jgi:protein required for attachment to host cells
MDKIGIIAADRARARFITAEVLDDTEFEGNPRLTERDVLANPLAELPPRANYSDRPSRKPSGAGPKGALPATDDHRERHEIQDERRFAQRILEAADRFVQAERPSRLLLLAEPHLLGLLRGELSPQRWSNVEVQDVAQDFSNHSLPELRDVLTRRGILPEPQLPRAGIYRPRGQEPTAR